MTSIKSATDIDAYIGQKICGYRNQHKLTQEQLGQQLGVSFQQVQKYERGVNRITGSRLQQIAQIFKVEITDLLPEQRAGKKPKELSNVDRIVATRDGMKLVDSFVSIKNGKLRAAIVELAERFAGQ